MTPAEENDVPPYQKELHGQSWSAFADLTEQLRGRLERCIGLLIGDFDEAASIVQEAFTRGWNSRDRLEDNSPIYPWIRAIAVNLAKQTLEKRRTRARLTDFASDFDPHSIVKTNRSVLSELIKDELAVKVWLAIGQLPEAYREAVVLHYVDGMDYDTMAQLTGSTAGALRARAMRARQLLKGTLGNMIDTWMRLE